SGAGGTNPGNVGGERKPREAVTRQEPLGSEVSVGVEIRMSAIRILVAQQPKLTLRLAPTGFGAGSGLCGDGCIEHDPVLFLLIGERRSIQLAPPVTRTVERPRRCRDHRFGPTLMPPRGGA